jgi:hypothetical protein
MRWLSVASRVNPERPSCRALLGVVRGSSFPSWCCCCGLGRLLAVSPVLEFIRVNWSEWRARTAGARLSGRGVGRVGHGVE